LKIDLLLSRSEIQPDKVAGRLVVIIDVWRASTSIITALANGCAGIIPVAEVEQARALAKKFPPNSILLGGERNELPIPGFDLSNSPLDYSADLVKNKRIIFTSSNGAKLFSNAHSAEKTVVGGFLNVTILSDLILGNNLDVSILCAGKNGQFGLEDAVCGGMIIDKVIKKTPGRCEIELNDGALAARILYDFYANNLSELIYQSSHGKRLIEIGQEPDLLISLSTDSKEIIPILKNDQLISYDVVNLQKVGFRNGRQKKA